MAVPQRRVGDDVVGLPVGVVVDARPGRGRARPRCMRPLGDRLAVRRPHRHRGPRRAAARRAAGAARRPARRRRAPGTSAPSAPGAEGERAAVGDDDGPAHAALTAAAAASDGAARSSAARSTSTAWGRSSCSGRLRWMRSPEVDLGQAVRPEALRHVDQQSELDAVAAGEAELLEDPAVRRRLAGQRLAHPGELGEEQLEHGPGHELGDPAAAGGLAVQRAGVEALDQRDVVGGEQRPEQPGDEGRVSCWPRRRRGRPRRRRSRPPSAAAMAWPLPPAPPGPATTGPRRRGPARPCRRATRRRARCTSSTSPFPPCAARKGWTTARTTEPTVEPSSRAGMHTETVRPVRALASRTRPVGKSPWWKVCATPPIQAAAAALRRPAPGGLPWWPSSRATEGRAR